jgi:hypothetical protein
VIRVQQTEQVSANQPAQDFRAFDQWATSKVFTIEPQNVERIEIGFVSSKQQIVELMATGFVQADNPANQ